jgi:Domain of unknown function (DUF4129)
VKGRDEKSAGGPAAAGGVALLIVGLLALVTLGAGGSRPSGAGGHLAARPVPATLQDSWITLLIIGYGVAIVGVLVVMFRHRHRWRDPESHWLRNYCAVLVFLTFFTAIGSWAIAHRHLRLQTQKVLAQQAQQRPGGFNSSAGPGRSVPARPAHFQWPLALAVGGFVLLGGAWIFIRRNRRSEDRATEPDGVEEELVRAIGTTIDDLRGERDARRAVIAAYANMERILASHGLARGVAEVPYEYLVRVLRLLQVRERPVRSLTELYEYAKFSEHEIDRTMKEHAIESLVMIREDLQLTRELAA